MARGPSQRGRINIRVLASVYIMYLAYSILKDWGEVPQNQKIGLGLAAVLFIVAPLFFLYTCWRDYKVMKAEEEAEAAENGAEAGPETLPAAQEPTQEEPADGLSDEEAAAQRERMRLAEKLAEEGRVEELDELLKQSAAQTGEETGAPREQ